jgi:hypothetical protein
MARVAGLLEQAEMERLADEARQAEEGLGGPVIEPLRAHDDPSRIGDIAFRGVIKLVNSYIPPKTCRDHMRDDLRFLLVGVDIEFVLSECIMMAESRLEQLRPTSPRLCDDEALAVVSYTYDLGCNSNKDGEDNLYVQLNNVLRERNPQSMMKLKPYLTYLMNGLSKLPAFRGTTYRGIPVAELSIIQESYLEGVAIHWSAFTSTTTCLRVARNFAGVGGIIFSIKCQTGRCVSDYSHFRDEAEIVLSPNSRFVVVSECSLESDGYYKIELVERRQENVVF